jgi:hypothetical protein
LKVFEISYISLDKTGHLFFSGGRINTATLESGNGESREEDKRKGAQPVLSQNTRRVLTVFSLSKALRDFTCYSSLWLRLKVDDYAWKASIRKTSINKRAEPFATLPFPSCDQIV